MCQGKCFSKKQARMRRDTHIRKRKDCYRNGRWCTLLKWRKSSSWRRKWSASWVLISMVYCTQHCCFQKTNLSLNSSVSLLVWFLPHFSHSSLPHRLSAAPSPQIAGRLGRQDPGCADWLRGLRGRPTWGPAGMRGRPKGCARPWFSDCQDFLCWDFIKLSELITKCGLCLVSMSRAHSQRLALCSVGVLAKWRVTVYCLRNGLLEGKVRPIERESE